MVALRRAHNRPQRTTRELDAFSPAVGYVLTILVSSDVISGLFSPVPLAANVQQRVEAFVLSTVDSMLDIAMPFPRFSFSEEVSWVSVIEKVLASPFRSEFITVLRAQWTADPFQAMLRSRNLSNATAEAKAGIEDKKARRIADIAVHGLHPCGLPSCDERKATVKQFKYCGTARRSGTAVRSIRCCTGKSTSPSAERGLQEPHWPEPRWTECDYVS